MKLIAINSLMHSDSDEAVPMLEKFLTGNASVKLKKKALFVLSQGGSPRARQVVTEIARGQRNPQLQSEALKYLGLFGGEQSRQALAEIYASTSDVDVKKEILHSFMLSGDKARVIAAARGEKDPALRDAAVKTLGIMGAQDELWQLYKSETSVPVRKGILHALFIGGAVDKLAEALRTERDPELRGGGDPQPGAGGRRQVRRAPGRDLQGGDRSRDPEEGDARPLPAGQRRRPGADRPRRDATPSCARAPCTGSRSWAPRKPRRTCWKS